MASPVGERVKELRTERRLTQEQLAARVGVSRKTVSNWEIGETTVSTAHLAAIAAALGVRETDLVGDYARYDAARSSAGARGQSSGYPTHRDTGTRFNLRDPNEQNIRPAVIGGEERIGSNVVGRVDDLRGPGAKPLPIYRWGSLGDPRDHMSAPSPDREDYPPTGRETMIGPNGFGVEVRGESMVGRDIRDGDVCWVNPDRPYRLGNVVLALVDTGDGDSGMVIKVYTRTDVGDCLMSEPESGKTLVIGHEFKIIGPVVWIQRGFPPR